MTGADKLVRELATLTDPLENDDAAEILDAFVSWARTIVRNAERPTDDLRR
jgi:cob(I)alamin adenosyltransferase